MAVIRAQETEGGRGYTSFHFIDRPINIITLSRDTLGVKHAEHSVAVGGAPNSSGDGVGGGAGAEQVARFCAVDKPSPHVASIHPRAAAASRAVIR